MSDDLVPYSNPQEGGTAVNLPAGGDASSAGRRIQIETVMREDYGRYLHEGMDREYRALLRAESGTTTPTESMDANASRQALAATPEGARLAWDWDRMGGFRLHLGRVQERVGELVREIGNDREQRVFMERFDRSLSERARCVVYDEIAMGAPTWVTPVDAAGLKKFGANSVGAELIAEWGSDAAANVARVWQRVERLKEVLGDEAEDSSPGSRV